jgi:2,5-diamino-6-(ribosylamino)-4(3H)-pyrimidinone 5'-phosphate reductase
MSVNISVARDVLVYPPSSRSFLQPYLPPSAATSTQTGATSQYPFVTLTYATSLEGMLSLAPSIQTALSSRATKAMTHYLRATHDAILIAVGTAAADNPTLDCRLEELAKGQYQEAVTGRQLDHPIPIVVDPHGRWMFTKESKLIQASIQRGRRGPLILTTENGSQAHYSDERAKLLAEAHGQVQILNCNPTDGRFDWEDILRLLADQGIKSVMIEGGGDVIRTLLSNDRYVNRIGSVIITIAPVWLGQGGVETTPKRVQVNAAVARLCETTWSDVGGDGVLCGRFKK